MVSLASSPEVGLDIFHGPRPGLAIRLDRRRFERQSTERHYPVIEETTHRSVRDTRVDGGRVLGFNAAERDQN